MASRLILRSAMCLALLVAAIGLPVAGTETYTYDDMGRLIRVEYADGTVIDYVYDTVGNRILRRVAPPGSPANNPPAAPSSPSPGDGASGVSTSPTLGWTGGDPDAGDEIVYSLYISTGGDYDLVYSGLDPGFELSTLDSFSTCSWYVVARDSRQASTTGPTWSFTTGNAPPTAEFEVTPLTGWAPLTAHFLDLSTDADGSVTAWAWDLDGDAVTDSTEQFPVHAYTVPGSYTVSLTVYDQDGAQDTETKIDIVTVYGDTDSDGIRDALDNCPLDYNPAQRDTDADGAGDPCDPDADDDGEPNESDNCIIDANADQADADADGFGDACTTVHCVASAIELEAALNAAANNGSNDRIRIVQGAYPLSGTTSGAFQFVSGEPYWLLLQGGYAPGCGSRTIDPLNTALDGEDAGRVLSISENSRSPLTGIVVEGLTMRNGDDVSAAGLFLYNAAGLLTVERSVIEKNHAVNIAGGAYLEAGFGPITLDRVMLRDNSGSTFGGAQLRSTFGDLLVVNSVVTGNSSSGYAGGLTLYTIEGNAALVNNTVIGNSADPTWGFGAGVYLNVGGASAIFDVCNNILWGNTASSGADLYIGSAAGSTVTVVRNDVGDLFSDGPTPVETGNFDADPQVDDTVPGYPLLPGSPCLDAGDDLAPMLPAVDIDGDDRTLGLAVDVGANEFADPASPYSIQGEVLSSGSGLSGIVLQLSGDHSASKVTDENGRYTLTWLPPGSYVVTPTDPYHDFVPSARPVTITDADVPGQDFTASDRDADGDGVPDQDDNCPQVPNPGQADADGDGFGDACDLPGSISGTITDSATALGVDGASVSASGYGDLSDAAGDYTIAGLPNGEHWVSVTAAGYLGQTSVTTVGVLPSTDTAGIDFALIPDADGDGVADSADNCPIVANADQADLDGDGAGDPCDPDIDGDGVPNDSDNCTHEANAGQEDADLDGFGDACTVNHCVATSAELQAALITAGANDKDDVVTLVQGTYGVSANGHSTFYYSSTEPRALVLRGGYAAGCLSRTLDPANTILDGESSARVVGLSAWANSAFARLIVEGLTVRNGSAYSDTGLSVATDSGRVVLRQCVIEDNVAENNTAGLRVTIQDGPLTLDRLVIRNNSSVNTAGAYVTSSGGDLLVTDCVVETNDASGYGGGLRLYMQAGVGRIVNNTITGNTANPVWGYGGGLYLDLLTGAATVDVYNNVLWGNSASYGGDVYLSNVTGAAVTVAHNDFSDLQSVGTAPAQADNLDADPLLVDAASGDYHLAFGSPCIDAGDAAAPGLPPTDYEGDARLLGLTVDLGADEFYDVAAPYTISGEVLEGGSPLPGITLYLTGDAGASRVTDGAGGYGFTWLPAGSYTVTPASPYHAFSPTHRDVILVDADATGQDFTATAIDSDGDGVPDTTDNCPQHPNADQSDVDSDGWGDVCDLPGSISGRVTDELTSSGIQDVWVRASNRGDYTDVDGYYTILNLYNADYAVQTFATGYINESYPTLVTVIPMQDTPGIDFALMRDTDGDGIADPDDNCPLVANTGQTDMDDDGEGDACDPDVDGDGVSNVTDNCPYDANPGQVDTYGDGYGDACTTYHCVLDASALSTALGVTPNNGTNDVIRLYQGSYAGSTFGIASAERYALVLRGGYGDALCSTRVLDPANTILDGENLRQALSLSSSSTFETGQLEIEGITVRNGQAGTIGGASLSSYAGRILMRDSIIEDNLASNSWGGALLTSVSGPIVVRRTVVRNNSASTSNGGIGLSTSEGDIELSSCIVEGNTSGNTAGVRVETSGGRVDIVNNTISGNGADPGFGYAGGIHLRTLNASVQADVYNNIIRDNTGSYGQDVYVYNYAAATVNLQSNDYTDPYVNGTAPVESGTLDLDPLFVDAGSGDYHLTADSPCIDAGDATAPVLPATDIDGEDRVRGLPVDIGADERCVSYPETCDGIDNNCDDAVDEGFPVGDACTSGIGECARDGFLACTGDGTGTECDATPGEPTAEICHGLDNNCDGTPDEGFDQDTDGVADCFDNCPLLSNEDQTDQDGDGLGDVCDCAPLDPHDPPDPVGESVELDRTAVTDAVLSWSDDGVSGTFGVYRGSRAPAVAFAYGHACLGSPTTSTTVTDGDVPVVSELYYYLISRIGCAESDLGSDSSGVLRPNPSPCP